MKQKKLRILALLLALAVCLSACGAAASTPQSSSSKMAMSASREGNVNTALFAETESADALDTFAYDASDEMPGESALQEEQTAETDRKIVYTGSLDLETKQFDDDLAAILRLVEEAGGYVSSQQISGESLTYRGSYYARYATMTVRVPAAQLDALMNGLSGVCNVTSRSIWSDDISDTYYDAAARLETLQLQEERLLDILSKADRLEDIITLESALSDVRYQIESLTAQLRRMDNRVEYSTLDLSINEVVEYSELEREPVSFGERLSAAAKRSVEKVGAFFEDLALWIVEDLPLLLLWLVLLGFVLWIVRKLVRRFYRPDPDRKPLFSKKKKSNEPTDKGE